MFIGKIGDHRSEGDEETRQDKIGIHAGKGSATRI
jgi:hypothetical protein